MTNEEYLDLSGRTAKEMPEGLIIPSTLTDKVEALLIEFRDTALQLENLKKEIFYRLPETQEEGVACKSLNSAQSQTLHAVLGMIGELSEVVDCFSNEMDSAGRDELVKELGDFHWYEAILHRLVGITADEIHEKNIAKLKARYPEGFSAEAALTRADVSPQLIA